MRINFFNRLFRTSSSKITEQAVAASENLRAKAEQRLQSRLTEWQRIMKDVRTGDYLELSTGKKFTGKFAIKAGELEQLHDVKNGKIITILIRDKNGKNHYAIKTLPRKKMKTYGTKEQPEQEWGKLAIAQRDAEEQMRHRFVINELMKSGKDSIWIQGNF